VASIHSLARGSIYHYRPSDGQQPKQQPKRKKKELLFEEIRAKVDIFSRVSEQKESNNVRF
jgi:hypothetical protein